MSFRKLFSLSYTQRALFAEIFSWSVAGREVSDRKNFLVGALPVGKSRIETKLI